MKKMQIYCYAGKNPRCQPSPISIGDVCAFPAAKQQYCLIISCYPSQKIEYPTGGICVDLP